jgi:hypothetical protein
LSLPVFISHDYPGLNAAIEATGLRVRTQIENLPLGYHRETATGGTDEARKFDGNPTTSPAFCFGCDAEVCRATIVLRARGLAVPHAKGMVAFLEKCRDSSRLWTSFHRELCDHRVG